MRYTEKATFAAANDRIRELESELDEAAADVHAIMKDRDGLQARIEQLEALVGEIGWHRSRIRQLEAAFKAEREVSR